MSNRIALAELETYLYASADILRGHVEASDYKSFVFPLLFFKRICDVYDEETTNAIKEYGEDPAKAEKLLAQSDKRRARHYEEFTDSIWGARRNYDLMLNSAAFGIDAAAEIICNLAK